jgi:hypothetical protein
MDEEAERRKIELGNEEKRLWIYGNPGELRYKENLTEEEL